MYNIIIYKNQKGESEIEEYIKELRNKKDKSNNIKFNKIISYIRKLEEKGLQLGEPFIKYIEDEI